jgi:hypothetical protein
MNYLEKEIKLKIKKYQLKGATIAKFNGEGCQGRGDFQWIGKVIGFRYNNEQAWEEVIIHIIKHNFSYCDARDEKQPEEYTYPLVNNDIQNVKGVWILFT